jgi:hypothetical protein
VKRQKLEVRNMSIELQNRTKKFFPPSGSPAIVWHERGQNSDEREKENRAEKMTRGPRCSKR